MSDIIDFLGKVVIITGSTSGIGEGIAIHFSKLGANVVITGRNEKNVIRVAELCESVSPKQIKPLKVVADISIDSDAKRLIDTTVEEFGKIDVFVNNAGAYWPTNINDINLVENYDKTMRMMLRAPVILTHLAVGYLEITKGCVINISSIGAFKYYNTMICSCMAKSALNMFTKCLAIELGPKNIRVNAINPGFVNSNFIISAGFSKEMCDKFFENFRNQSPLGVTGDPQYIANMVAFLASNNAKFITGSCVVVDGGVDLK